MATFDELSLRHRIFVHTYRWRRNDPVPWTPFTKKLEEATVAIVSTAGLVLPDQKPFDGNVKGGDPSFRLIPADADVSTLVDTHRSDAYDHTAIAADRNLGFPLGPLRALVADGLIGGVAPQHLSFMGSITAPGRLIRDVAPDAVREIERSGADAVVLVPV